LGKVIASHKLLFTIVLLILVMLLYFARPWQVAKKPPKIGGRPMSLIHVFAASKTESHSVEQLINRSEGNASGTNAGRIGANEVVVFITGIGPKSARSKASSVLLGSDRASTHSTLRRPDAVVVVGMCGSLTSAINESEVIVYTDCLSSGDNSSRVGCTTSLFEHITALLKSKNIICRSAAGISATRIATTKDEKLALAKSGATVVDMESYEIVAAAIQARLPVAVIRVVSDSLERELPDLNVAIQENGEVNSLQLLRIFIGSPILTSKVFAASRRALRTLSSALEIVLGDGSFSSLHSETPSH
jgi:nucleoside phosphorylase